VSFHEYSSDYTPPMPICELYLGAPDDTPKHGPFVAILDTGSDATIVPVRYLDQIGAAPFRRRRVRSVWGDSRMIEIYVVSFALNGLSFKLLDVVGDDQGDEIIVGRFVLNRLKVILDGPAAMTEIVEGPQ
jgi:predicted aspartyl protease